MSVRLGATRNVTSWLPSSCTSMAPATNSGCRASAGLPATRRPSGEYGVGSASMPVAASAARASSRVIFCGLIRRSSGAAASHARASAARSASPYVVPSRSHSQSGRSAATAGASGSASRDLNSRNQATSSAPMTPSHSRSPMPSSRTRTASARRRGARVCASSVSERRLRNQANTPSAISARSCCPIALCRRKKSCSSESAGYASASVSAMAAASPATWFARGLIGVPSRFALRYSRSGRPFAFIGAPLPLRAFPPRGSNSRLGTARRRSCARHCRASVSSTRIESSVASSVAPKMLL